MTLARELSEQHSTLGARDLCHLASCRRGGVGEIMTFDEGLGAVFVGARGGRLRRWGEGEGEGVVCGMTEIKSVAQMHTYSDNQCMGVVFDWTTGKNHQLVEQRGVSFESVVSAIEQGGLLDVLEHPEP